MSNLSNSRSIQAEFKLWRKNSQACRALEISLAVVLFCSALPDIGGYGGQSGVQLDIIFQMSLIQRIFFQCFKYILYGNRKHDAIVI